MKFRPLHDRVVVKRVEEDTKTKGGIIIPDTAQEKPMQGKVIAVGPGGRDDHGKLTPIDLKKGDTVLFGMVIAATGANGNDFALHGLFLGGVGNDDPALGLGVFLDPLHDNAVVQWTKLHG